MAEKRGPRQLLPAFYSSIRKLIEDLWHLPPVSWCVVYWAALALRDTVIWELAINIVELTNEQENKTIRCTTTSESWMIGVELEHWLWYRSVLVFLDPDNFVAQDLYRVDGCRLSWVWACVGADVMHVCGCCWLIACSASVCPRRCFRSCLSHAYANLDCGVALLLSYY